jgi:3-methylcrotonyl-CoA carboxylase alpha subunit
LQADGHAIEARIYAENPSRRFLPSTGTLKHLNFPEAVEFQLSGNVRIDSGVREGDTITPFYDPMIAKLIVHGRDRDDALLRMALALKECEVVGPSTNIEFLHRIVVSEPFSSADLDTGLIERHHDTLFAPSTVPKTQALALACAALLTREGGEAHGVSPWDALSHWRMSGGYRQALNWRLVGSDNEILAVFTRDSTSGRADNKQLELLCETFTFDWSHGDEPHAFVVLIGDKRIKGRVFIDGDVFHVFYPGASLAFEWQNLLAPAGDAEHGEGRLTAPTPGKVIAVLVEVGAVVEKGAPLLVMEAMKMEHTIVAPGGGTVGEILFSVGDQVSDGAQLLKMEVTK